MPGRFTGKQGGIRVHMRLPEKVVLCRTQKGGWGSGKIQHQQQSRGWLCGFSAVKHRKSLKQTPSARAALGFG